jgi:putative endonuclease
MKKGGATYIITNKNNTTLYVGVTSRLKERIWEHKTKKYPDSFSARYNLNVLVYYESFLSIEAAIQRENALKGKSRNKKIELINALNPKWLDLFDDL